MKNIIFECALYVQLKHAHSLHFLNWMSTPDISEINYKSLKFLKQLEEMETPDLPLDVEKAMIFTGLENFDKAFALLNSAVDKKLGGMNFIKSKYWRDLHDDPRYIEILKRMNLPLD